MRKNYLINLANKLVVKYSNENKLLDDTAIEFFVKEAINFYDLNEYVEYLEFAVGTSRRGCYNYGKKRLSIYLDAYKESLQIYKNEYKDIFKNDHESCLQINLEIIKTLIHEVTHIKQRKEYNENPDSLEAILFKDSYLDHALTGIDHITAPIFYILSRFEYSKSKKFYRITPMEREAFLDSSSFVCDMLKDNYYDKYYNVRDYNSYRLLSEILRGYGKNNNISPILTYIKIQDRIKQKCKTHIKTINVPTIERIAKTMTLQQRIHYGFRITESEFNELKTLKESTNAYRTLKGKH